MGNRNPGAGRGRGSIVGRAGGGGRGGGGAGTAHHAGRGVPTRSSRRGGGRGGGGGGAGEAPPRGPGSRNLFERRGAGHRVDEQHERRDHLRRRGPAVVAILRADVADRLVPGDDHAGRIRGTAYAGPF